MLSTIIVILLVLFLIYGLPFWVNIYKTRRIIRNHTIKSASQIKFHTGDLLFFRWNYTIGSIDKNNDFILSEHINVANTTINLVDSYLYNIPFIHVGMVVYYAGSPYILELNVSDMYCEYEKKVLRYRPTLISLNTINNYYGISGVLPYVGPSIDVTTTLQIIKEKNQYIHARQSTLTMAGNLSNYVFNSKTSHENPAYINCGQYIYILLKKMNIITDPKNIMSVTPHDIYTECSKGLKYGDFIVLKNNYFSSMY